MEQMTYQHGDHVEFRYMGDIWLKGVVMAQFGNGDVAIQAEQPPQVYERSREDVRHAQVQPVA
jgi:hypothetical protein